MKLKYFDISWISSVDGPGTRVVLYLSGCHLKCPWCHSPHSWKTPHLLFFESRCLVCGECVDACTHNVHRIEDGKHILDRSNCIQCGLCIESCPSSESNNWNTGALGFAAYEKDVQEIFELLKPQLKLFKNIGGLTVSGGDPMLQSEALAELLVLCKQEGFHTAVETSASIDKKHFEPLLPIVSHWLIGLRPSQIDEEDNWEHILDNVDLLASYNAEAITIRTPIIPGYTNTLDCFIKIKKIMLAYSIKSIELLPFNPYSENYYKAMGIIYPLQGVKLPTEDEMNQIKEFFTSQGLNAEIVV